MSLFIVQRFGVYHWESFLFTDGSSKDKFFVKKTVIDFKNIHQIKSNELKISKITYKGILESHICKRIEDTIKNSKLLTKKRIKELVCEK